ncbi:hypothetical protein CkP1_0122 [Citrobacter phage CkP1]|nr:hypothetical protein CkP1_0122 [Citrobacter phage CkP1]
MGAGVAGQLAKAYPVVFSADKGITEYGDKEKLGTYSRAVKLYGHDNHEVYCFNLYTQYYPGANVDYGAILYAFQELNAWAETQLYRPKIYIPRIGAGIAGGDWHKIEVIIDMFTPDIDIVVVDWDGE